MDTLNQDVALLWANWPLVSAVAAGGTAVLIALAWLLRRKSRDKLSRRVTTAATMLGLGWSAQGMWDTAVHHYKVDSLVAWVLFIVFEAMLAGRMLKAHKYRADFARRPKHVASVWTIAVIMAVVVALGEGLAQAPARLAIPLLVAYGWYVDLTADDNPAERPVTSWRWTPRRLLLAIGAIEPGKRDAEEINHDRLRDRMTRLAFRQHHGWPWWNEMMQRSIRLQRLQTLADDRDVAEVRSRLARSRADLMTGPKPERQRTGSLKPPPAVQIGKMGVHSRAGRSMRGQELHADGIDQMLTSVTPDFPRGMSISQLAALYDPPLKTRTAETIASAARRQIPRPVNGFSQETA